VRHAPVHRPHAADAVGVVGPEQEGEADAVVAVEAHLLLDVGREVLLNVLGLVEDVLVPEREAR
jgi:hypothetical protein